MNLHAAPLGVECGIVAHACHPPQVGRQFDAVAALVHVGGPDDAVAVDFQLPHGPHEARHVVAEHPSAVHVAVDAQLRIAGFYEIVVVLAHVVAAQRRAAGLAAAGQGVAPGGVDDARAVVVAHDDLAAEARYVPVLALRALHGHEAGAVVKQGVLVGGDVHAHRSVEHVVNHAHRSRQKRVAAAPVDECQARVEGRPHVVVGVGVESQHGVVLQQV